MNCTSIIIVSLLIGLAGCTKKPVQANQLFGAWQAIEMYIITSDQDSIKVPINESLIIFGDGYYSMMYAFGKERSPNYVKRWHPNDSEKVARFSSLIINSGSYRIEGSRIYGRPLFALAPEFVEGQAIFSFKFAEDTLELTWEKSIAFDGLEYPSGGTVTFLRLVRTK